MRCTMFLLGLLTLFTLGPRAHGMDSTASIDLSSIDLSEAVIKQLVELGTRSPQIQSKLSGGLPWHRPKSILHNLNDDGTFASKHLEKLQEMVHDALRKSGRYENVRWRGATPKVEVTPELKIIIGTFTFNGYEVTKACHKDRLTVRILICPNQTVANTISWLRRGNEAPKGETLEKRVAAFESHDLGFYYFEDLDYGELAYGICPNFEMEALPKDDLRSIQTRGFQRKNVIVEASTRTLFLDPATDAFASSGPDGESWGEIDRMLSAVDKVLLKKRR